jgi:hypothetical protein
VQHEIYKKKALLAIPVLSCQGRYLIAVPKFLEPRLGTKHYFGACHGQVYIIVSPKKNRPQVYILRIDTKKALFGIDA